MAKVKCPNGHVFETNIYGSQCPLCGQTVGAASPAETVSPTQRGGIPTQVGRTESPAPRGVGGNSSSPRTRVGSANPVGQTLVNNPSAPNTPQSTPQAGPRTTIRRTEPTGQVVEGRKLVGFLVCYNRFPNGKAFNIYEGRNFVGRDPNCDISIPDDTQMSSRHMSIMYRSVDNKFKFRDEQSSNGTFINKTLLDDGELQNYDIIRVGGTLFVFVAIPQIG